jgi:O-acetyl-ADP-ribose deacetylase (regulator of RNase III)
MEKRIGKSVLELRQGDITALEVDAIVNAANKFLAHGGGVALAILRKGGPQIQAESTVLVAKRGPLKTGDAVITSAGNLPARYVIHTVGPVWGDQDEMESDALLRRSVRNSLALAVEHGVKTVALPAISTGIYRFPAERAGAVMIDETVAVLRGETTLDRVIFCLYDAGTFSAFEAALDAASG